MTHITDQQRREVAARLRESEPCEPPLIPDSLCDMCRIVSEVAAPGISLCKVEGRCPEVLGPLIADLIDRPTCNVLHQVGNPFGICSNCGKEVFADLDEPSNYCPECGAEVV